MPNLGRQLTFPPCLRASFPFAELGGVRWEVHHRLHAIRFLTLPSPAKSEPGPFDFRVYIAHFARVAFFTHERLFVVLPRLTVGQFCFALIATLLWPCISVYADEKDRSSLTNFDKRVSWQAKKNLRPAQQVARNKLKNAANAQAEFDPILGSPKWIHVQGGFLTEAGGEGRAVAAGTARQFDKDPDKPVKAFLQEHRELFGHGAEVLDGAPKRRDHTNHFGARTVAWEQEVDGIPVFDSIFVANTTARGELISISSLFVPTPDKAADRGTPQRALKSKAPVWNAERAVRASAADVGESVTEVSPLDARTAGRTLKQTFRVKPLPGEARASLVWFPLDGDTLRLCWEVELTRREFNERFKLLVDAETGEVLLRRKLTVEVSEVLYRVYTSDSPSPFSPTYAFPTNTQPPMVPRQLLAISNLNATASPLGWLNDDTFETRGNNVDARLDRDGDDRADLPRIVATNAPNGRRVFDFPIDFTQNPSTYASAANVQLFYWCNWMHDKLYEVGFTESAGNFQKDNFGRGGADNDAIVADAQDGSGVNNANYTPSRDGSPGRIQMFTFTGNPGRDGDFDTEVILHEYAHGLTDRMVGGGVGLDFFGRLQCGGLGEGWSDFYALALLGEFGDDVGGNYAMSGYVTYQFLGLAQNYYYGIRRYPYTTNMNVNPLTFADIDSSTASLHAGVPRNPIIVSSGNEVHRQGEVWCAMLWDMRAFLLNKYAPTNAAQFDAANTRILRYVTEGLNQSPANPNFAQARDGILKAIMVAGGGSDTNEAWRAFARRGLGVNAICPDSSTTLGVVQSFDEPRGPDFDVLSPSVLQLAGPVGGPLENLGVTNVLINLTTGSLGWAASASFPSGMAPWLRLLETNGVLSPNVPRTNVAVVVSAANALSAGNYQATLFFTNLSTPTQVVSRLVFLSVLSPQDDPLVVTPPITFLAQGPRGGPFNPTANTYRLANTGTVPLGWRALASSNWLSVNPDSGLIEGNGAFTNIRVSINSNANTLPAGTYFASVSVINTNSGARVDLPVSLRVASMEYFMEDFSGREFDLTYSTLTLTPDLSTNFYRACREPATAFPVSPAGGVPLTLADDQYLSITLTNEKQVSIFGTRSSSIFIGANGNLTLDPGSNTNAFIAGYDEFFGHVRVAPVFADLNPADGGTVSYRQLEDRLVVTWQDVPEFGTTNLNNLQAELFFTGGIRMTWLQVQITNPQNPVLYVGLSRGTGTPGAFVQSDLSAYGGCLPDATLVVPSSSVEGIGSLQGTIFFSAALTNDLIVALTSSDTNEVEVPSVVIVPAGQTSVVFPLQTLFDDLPDGTQRALITATFPDRPAVTAAILVHDNESGGLTLNVPFQGIEGAVLASAGVVTADVIAVRPITIHLTSDNPDRVRVQPFVVIEPGQNSARFDLVLVNNTLLDGYDFAVIGASVVNWTDDYDVIRANDDESTALVVTLPAKVTEGQQPNTGGNVLLGGRSLSNVVIALRSDQPSILAVPTLVTNFAGQFTTPFKLTVGNNTVTNAFEKAHITATAIGFLSGTGAVSVVDDERPFAPGSPNPFNGAAHVARDVELSWSVTPPMLEGTVYDVYFGTNSVLTAADLLVTTATPAVPLPRHLEPETIYYWRVNARLAPFPEASSPVWRFTTATFGLELSPISSPQFVGETFPVIVKARDEHGLMVTNYSGIPTVTNSVPVASSSTIVITELDAGGFNRVEFVNVAGRPINIGGWKIALYDWQSWPAPRTVFTIPSPATASAGDLFQLRSLPPQFFPGAYPSYSTANMTSWNYNADNNQIAVVLLDGFSNVVDFACASGADPGLISQPVALPPGQWSSPPISTLLNSALSYQRIGRKDLNSSNDWVFAPRSIGTNNTGLSASFSNNVRVAFSAGAFSSFSGGSSTGAVTILEQANGVTVGVADSAGHGGVSNPFDVLSRNDLALTVQPVADVLVGSPVTYRFTITNTGPMTATGVRFTDVMFTNSVITSATASQGDCAINNGVVSCDLGPLAGASIANITVTAATLSRSTITNFASISRSEADANLANNHVVTRTAVTFPQVSILDTTNSEPNVGSSILSFIVRLSSPSTLTSTVAYATSNGTAASDVDYNFTEGVVTFMPGVTNQIVDVTVLGDTLSESNETVFVTLAGANGVEINRGRATGNILDNDGVPGISVGDVTIVESDSGATNVTFRIQLSKPSGKIAHIAYATGGGTALPGFDYLETYGTLLFAPGVTNLSVAVPVLGDLVSEPSKTFFLNLTAPGNVFIDRPQGTATILDNDIATVDHFTFAPISSTNYAGRSLPFEITARGPNGVVASEFNGFATLQVLKDRSTVSIGSNATPWALPFATSFHDARLQSIYLSNEVGRAGRILGLSLEVTSVPGQTLSNFTIRLRHSTQGSHVVPEWNAFAVTNYQNDVLVSSTGWVQFAFTTPFDYNGRDHLVVDLSFNNSSFSADGFVRSSATAGNRSVYLRTDSAYGDPLNWMAFVTSPPPTAIARVPNVRLHKDGTTSPSPLLAGSFVNGIWDGDILLPMGSTNMVLRVVDQEGHFGESDGFVVLVLSANIMRKGSSIEIEFATINGSQYVVESSASLNGPWSPISETLTGDGRPARFIRTPGTPQEFYRLRLLP